MATLQIVDNFSVAVVDTIETAFEADPSKGYVIEAFTAVNNSQVNASYKAYIVTSSGLVKPIVPFKVVVWGKLDLGIGINNQIIPAGGFLRVESSAIDSIYFTVTAREVSL